MPVIRNKAAGAGAAQFPRHGRQGYDARHFEGSAGTPACNGKRIENWPPLVVDTGAVPRAGYSRRGKRLNCCTTDAEPSDTAGDGGYGYRQTLTERRRGWNLDWRRSPAVRRSRIMRTAQMEETEQ
jgi:hypothetical protein